MSTSVPCPGGIPAEWRSVDLGSGVKFQMGECGMCQQIIRTRKLGGYLPRHDLDYSETKQGTQATYYWTIARPVDVQALKEKARKAQEVSENVARLQKAVDEVLEAINSRGPLA